MYTWYIYTYFTVANHDYDSGVHTIPIPSDETTFTYNLMINDDNLFETNETFKLEIIESSLHEQVYRRGPYITAITINNNDERE